jgi:hypothetical protein
MLARQAGAQLLERNAYLHSSGETAGLVVGHPRTRNGSRAQIVPIGAKIGE